MKHLRRFFESELHKKIIIFFFENRASVDTPRGVATWVGATRQEARKALDELAADGVLNIIETSSTSGYSFTDKPEIETEIILLIEEFNKNQGQ